MFGPVSPEVLPIITLVEVAKNNIKLHPSVRDIVKIIILTHSMESSMTKVDPVRLVSKPTYASNSQFQHPCTHIGAKPKLIFNSKRLALVDDKCKELEEIILTKPVPHTKRKVSKMLAMSCRRYLGVMVGIYVQIHNHTVGPPVDIVLGILLPVNHF
ncbi:hypothetical protein ACTXT7_008567 [Hymenolepis weldensis]